MKIEVGIITRDELWFNRLIDKLSLSEFLFYRYHNKDMALNSIEDDKVKVLLVDDDIHFADEELVDPKICRNVMKIGENNKAGNVHILYHTALAFLEHNDNIEEDYESPTVLKYAPLSVFIQQIESLYNSLTNERYKLKRNSSSTYVLNVTSPVGGVGVTTLAICICELLAKKGKRVLYVSLDKFANNRYFNAVGTKTLSDIIFSLKIQNSDLKLAMQQAIRKCERSGVHFIEPSENPYDAYEMTDDETLSFINAVTSLDFDYCVFDTHGTLDQNGKYLLQHADLNIVVANGKPESNEKVQRFYNVVRQIDENSSLIDTLCLVYNAFGSASSRIHLLDDGSTLGINRYDGYSFKEIIRSIVLDNKLEQVINRI